MSTLSFFWHDYETFGRNPRRDRPAQFAGLRTDAELNEVGEPVMAFCQPAADSLPEPQACLLTGITPQVCAARGLPERDFAQQIWQALAEPGTVGVGYNSIRFDDEVSRHLFWRNLIDPYGREWQNQCSRWDLLDLVRCAHALRPEGIEWPHHDDGRVSFRLEQLTLANGLQHEAAHDALSDVRGTLALARLLRQRQPRLWDFCLALRKKDAVWQQIGPLGPARRPLLHVSGMFPVERGCLGIVWPLAAHPSNKNELLVWDLAFDPAELLALDLATLRQRLFTRTAELPEGLTRLPIKGIHVNKSPVVIGNLKTLTEPLAQRWGLDLASAHRHAAWAQANAAALDALPWADVYQRPAGDARTNANTTATTATTAAITATATAAHDVDEDLYGGFIAPADRRTLDHLRTLAPDQLVARRPGFEDGRLEELLFRYRARHWPALLDGHDRQRWQQHLHDRLHLGHGGGQTLAQFHEHIDALAETADERGQAILSDLVDWAEQIAPEPA